MATFDEFLDRVQIYYANYPALSISNVATVEIDASNMEFDDMEHYTRFMYDLYSYCYEKGFKTIGIHESIPSGDSVFIGIDILEESNYGYFCRAVCKYSYRS